MKTPLLFLFRCGLLIKEVTVQTGLFCLTVLLIVTQGNPGAVAAEMELNFSIPEVSKNLTIAPEKAVIKPTTPEITPPQPILSPPAVLSPLEVATPYLIDDTPPGSYDFTLLRDNRDDVKIPSPCQGLVTYTKLSEQGYGNRVEILCDHSGYVYFMTHLKTIAVRVGQRVNKGESLGIQGSTGNSTGPHVHLEIGTRPFLEFYPENRIINRSLTRPLVESYFDFVSRTGAKIRPEQPPVSPPRVVTIQPPKPQTSPLEKLGLEFELPSVSVPAVESKLSLKSAFKMEQKPEIIPQNWFESSSESPLAVAIGAAEGTRTVEGKTKPAYYWHSDPGNGKDNFGTFSYQHLPLAEVSPVKAVHNTALKRQISKELDLPQKADQKQLQRLEHSYQQLLKQAQGKGLELTQLEIVNGLDLINQSPLAGLSMGGYIDRLAQMKLLVKDSSEQLIEARVWSFWDMEKNTWDAPGLGNHYETIRRDQKRRFQQIQRVLEVQFAQR